MVTKPVTKPILTDLQKRPLIQSLSSLIRLLKGQISPQIKQNLGATKRTLYLGRKEGAPSVVT